MTTTKENAPAGTRAENNSVSNSATVQLSAENKNAVPLHYGASPAEWDHFDLVLGLTEDLLPVVSDPTATKAPESTMQGVGKTPSRFNRKGEMVGFAKWTSHTTTQDEIARWQKDSRLGICIQTRHVRAIDVDVGDFDEAFDIEEFVDEYLGIKLPCRRRKNSTKFLLAFRMDGEFTKRRFKTHTEGNFVEFLANGQQFVAIGQHTSGVRYEWDGGLPDSIPTLGADEFEALWMTLAEKFGSEDSVTTRTGVKPSIARLADDIDDPMVAYLAAHWEVFNVHSSGRVDIRCPFEAGHSTDSGPTSTSYYPAGVGGFKKGHFKCLHASCAHRTDQDFVDAVGYSAHGFEVLPDPTPEEAAEQAAIRQRNEERARKAAADAIKRAKHSSGRDALAAVRRDEQRKENQRIGEGEHTIPAAEVITLEEALNRFVFLSDGSRVLDIYRPHYDIAASDWATTYAASKEMIPSPGKFGPDGAPVVRPVPVSRLWQESPRRKTAVCRTFKAGGNLFLHDPEGRPAVNSWNPFNRSIEVADLNAAGLVLFLDHVEYLFGADAGRFLDWLAHIEQNPGTLPHTSWLHIATNFGMGRNWLASVLTRVWAGAVAANLDLVGMLKSGFNGAVSRKVLAVVDEIREGGRDSQWEHAENLKRIITEETRRINPKYGRQSVEYNACRWLMFSNHISAIPLDDGDRRVEVVITEALPRSEEYYSRLYAALNDPLFIAAVARFLGERDIAHFNPGAHAKQTEAKRAAAKASQTPAAAWCELLVAHWPSDLITAGDLYEVLEGQTTSGKGLNASHRRTLEQYRIEAVGRVKADGSTLRVSAVRNLARWKNAEPSELRAELSKVSTGLSSARDVLEDAAAKE